MRGPRALRVPSPNWVHPVLKYLPNTFINCVYVKTGCNQSGGTAREGLRRGRGARGRRPAQQATLLHEGARRGAALSDSSGGEGARQALPLHFCARGPARVYLCCATPILANCDQLGPRKRPDPTGPVMDPAVVVNDRVIMRGGRDSDNIK